MTTRNGSPAKAKTTPAAAKPAARKNVAPTVTNRNTLPPEEPDTVRVAAPAPVKSTTTPAPVGSLHQDAVATATPHAEEVILVFCAGIDAQNVTVAGTFNDWNQMANPLHRISPKTYAAKLKLAPGEYQYKFVVDGTWVPDPTARQNVPDGHGAHNSVLLV